MKSRWPRCQTPLLLALAILPGQLCFGRAIAPNQRPILFSPEAEAVVSARELRGGDAEFVTTKPWSTPVFKYPTGLLSARLQDKNYSRLESVRDRHAYFMARSLEKILAIRNSAERERMIATLSPAEKYDLVIGDLQRGFSTAIWSEVLSRYAAGQVPKWYGLCDGSSAASVLFSEPGKNVLVHSRIPGIEVPFYLGDIKALLSYSMSTFVSKDLPIIGERCRKSSPDISKGECFGVNPATLHQILTHMSRNPRQLPVMIIDRSPGESIWNAAVLNASFSYYDPASGRSVSDLAVDHLIDVKRYRVPPGSPGWARGARYLLFTSATLGLADTRTKGEFQSHGKMHELKMMIRYVLELNGNLEVVGGEWLSHLRPNFIWALPRDYRPVSGGDISTQKYQWEGVDVPDEAVTQVLRASRQGQPLFRIIDFIYQQSFL